jgi:hypothetical protein
MLQPPPAVEFDLATQAQFNRLGFEPYPEQRDILASDARFIGVTGGEQGGKSYVAAKYLISRLPEASDKGDVYWLVASDYNSNRREFDYLVQDLATLGYLHTASKRVDPGEIVLSTGAVIRTKSATDPRSLAMEAPVGILLNEAARVDQETYWRCRGRTAPKRGWLFMSGTLEGSLGWYPGLMESWRFGTAEDERSFKLPSWTNLSLYPGGRQDPEILRIERDAPDEYFLERMAGEPVPPKGAVFANYFRPHIHIKQGLEYDPAFPVTFWIDPGYKRGAHALEVIQIIDGVVCVVDEIYEQRGTEDMIDLAMQKPWWKPDMIRPGVIDVYAYQHHAMDVTPAEMWQKKAGLYFHSNKVRINDGIDKFKSFLKPNPITGDPKIFFAPHCRGVLSELGACPNPFDHQTRIYKWDITRDGSTVGQTPKDEYNHAIKAITYGLVDTFGYAIVGDRKKIPVHHW